MTVKLFLFEISSCRTIEKSLYIKLFFPKHPIWEYGENIEKKRELYNFSANNHPSCDIILFQRISKWFHKFLAYLALDFLKYFKDFNL